MVAERGTRTSLQGEGQYASGIALSPDAVDLYLSLSQEEANPVPLRDELVLSRGSSLVQRCGARVTVAITPYNGAVIMAFRTAFGAL